MEPQELLDSFHEAFRTINKRLEALEIIHARYTGPKGPKGDRGDSGPAGRDGHDGLTVKTDFQTFPARPEEMAQML